MRTEDLIITLVVLAVSGLSALFQKKRNAADLPAPPTDRPSPRPRPIRPGETPGAPPEPKPFDLEEALRRILEGDKPAEARPIPPPIPPPVAAPPKPPPVPILPPRDMIYSETEEPAAQAMGQLPQAARAYARAAQLHETTAARLREVDAATENAKPVKVGPLERTVSPFTAAAMLQLRNPQSARQALVTAIILAPPKALATSEI